jgi:cytochrome c5
VKPIVKRILIGAGGLLGAVVLGAVGFVAFQVNRFDSSMDKVYDVPVPNVVVSTDPAVIARGSHLAEAIAGCTSSDCHGADLAGGKTMDFGPLGKITGPNISKAGLGAAYTPGEMFRLVRHGLKKDGRSVRFMPANEIGWLPDSDITAIISYLATLPPVTKPNGPSELGTLAKVLDRFDLLALDVARVIDHQNVEIGPAPTPTAAYGRFLAKTCTGCHGKTLSGGPIPGAPPDLPVPSNITPDASGLRGWSYEDFDRLLTQGIRKNGKKLDPFMPISGFGKMDETEKRALWAHLTTLPPLPFGGR